MNFLDWLYNLMDKGLGHAIQRYYGIYRATVSDNLDPDKRGRIKIICPQVGQSAQCERWVMPAMAGGGGSGRGFFFAPEIDDTVWVSFYEGSPSHPEVYWGGWFGQSDAGSEVPEGLRPPASDLPEKKGIVTRAGHSLIFNDEAGKESVTIIWNKPKDGDASLSDRTKTAALNPSKSAVFSFDKNGGLFVKTLSSFLFQIDEDKKTVTLTTPDGSMLFFAKNGSINLIHKSGSSISMTDSSIDIAGKATMAVNISGQNVILNGGGVLVGGKAIDFGVLGLKLIKWLALHVHPTALGPSLPPMVPPTPADFCSKTVKIQD